MRSNQTEVGFDITSLRSISQRTTFCSFSGTYYFLSHHRFLDPLLLQRGAWRMRVRLTLMLVTNFHFADLGARRKKLRTNRLGVKMAQHWLRKTSKLRDLVWNRKTTLWTEQLDIKWKMTVSGKCSPSSGNSGAAAEGKCYFRLGKALRRSLSR